MKLAIMQPYFFPYIGYFQLLTMVDKFVIYDDVNFIKGGWINRNKILINNIPSFITIPIDNLSSFKRINDTFLAKDEYWKKKLLKSIQFNYCKTPYFNNVFPLIEDVILFEETNLSKYLLNSIKSVLLYLKRSVNIIKTSENYNNNNLFGKDRVIDICIKEKATEYINPIGGTELYNKEEFLIKGLDLKFIKPRIIKYNQFSMDFHPFLSIIDVLMFNSPDMVNKMLLEFDLV